MSSIDGKSGGNLPNLSGVQDLDAEPMSESAEGAAAYPADTPADAKARQIIAAQGGQAVLAMMGMTPAGLSRVLKGEPSNKFSTAATITSSPPPLPMDHGPITPEVQAHYASLSQDMATAMAQGTPTRSTGRSQSVGSAAAGAADEDEEADFATALSSISEEEANTPAGQEKIERIVAKGFSAASTNLADMGAGTMMQAFMILRVENKTSGKELQSTLQDLSADARNVELKKQQMENKAVAEATKKAAEKQEKMGWLAPLIEAIVAVVSAAVAIVTAGAGLGLAIVLAASVIGFLAGGAIGGATKGKGFDLTSAFTGMGIGAGVSRAAAMILTKLMAMALSRVATGAATQAASKSLSATSAKLVGNMSTKETIGQGIALGAVGMAGDVAKSVSDFKYAQMLLDAKKHQANSKMAQVMAEMMQNQWTAIQGTLTNMAENHTAAVNQVMSMMKAQFAATQKTVSQISR